MCGILGIFDRSGAPPAPEVLARMGQIIAHRGPDDHGVAASGGVAIGNRRLSIIDLAGGHQPVFSDDGRIALVQNGEIYNYVELAAELERDGIRCRTHSDTEVLLRLYERDGIEFVHRLNGMFAVAIHDGRTGELVLVRDRIGVKPLYLHDDGTRLCFGSEIKTLLAAGVRPELDAEALHHFLTFNYVPPPLTIFRGVRHLPPGHWLRISRESTEVQRWWRLEEQHAAERPIEAWCEEFLATLDDAVRLRLRADVPFGAFLSGGLDSSSVVALMSRHLREPVRTFSIGFDDPRYDESPFAQEVADRFATHHVMERVRPQMIDRWPRVLYHCDQPHGDVSFMPMHRLSELAVRHVKMVLTGDGGDELFGGYLKYLEFFERPGVAGLDDEGFRRAYHDHISLFDERGKRGLYTEALAKQVGAADSFAISAPHLGAASAMDRVNQALYLDCMLLLPGNNLVKPDRTTMAVSLEGRNPFLDVRMMELAFRIPGALKLREGQTRWLYKRAVAPLIGEGLAYRKKQMFTVPIGEWFKTELRAFCDDVLLAPRTAARGWFRPDAVRTLLDDHRAGAANRTREIRALIAVELWARTFLDGALAGAPGLTELGLAPVG